ncbi:MAG: VCBS repeat-containing protein [Bacteroidia bacterium]|nr:VCBS repeat-containing protein [Bacteroidia bacterium]
MWLLFLFIWTQLFLRPTAPIVSFDQDTLYNAWAGGWNSPQFSTIDIDGDGQAELFVFDRSDDRCMIFKKDGSRWIYSPEADSLFPQRLLSGWVLLRDYDGDGDKDLFTNINSNVRVFQNIAPLGAPPVWRLAYDTLRSLYAPNYPSYLYAARTDIPAIADIDGDGDIDLLVYEVLGTLIEWHKNQAVEQLGRPDTLILELQSSCWGHVFERYDYTTNTFSFIEYHCGPGQREGELLTVPPQGRIHHAGGTILAIDLNGDGLRDIVIGDDGPPYLIAGLNTGTTQIAHIEASTAISPYPVQNPLYMPSFPAAYYEDITGDGKPDLICANNSPISGEDRYTVWLYENIGRIDSPAWNPPIIGWLYHTMLDVGRNAHPTLADLNRDGYPDLILSSESFYTNTGTKARAILLWGTAQGFAVGDTNWLNLPSYNLLNPTFTVGDIDGNGRMDLIAGTSTGKLWRWEEQTAGGVDFSLVSQDFAGITALAFATPLLYDYDGDGDLDLIVGARNGRLSLYRQESGGSFTLVTNFLGQIELRDTLSTLLGFTRPALIDLDRNGTPELLVGNLTGFLRVYWAFWGAPTAAWLPIADLPYRWGKRASPTVWQQNDSTLILVGNTRGGVQAFSLTLGRSSLALSSSSSRPYTLLRQSDSYLIQADRPAKVSIYDPLGREIARLPEATLIYIPPLASGLYVLSVSVGPESFWEKIWIY